MVAPTNKLLIAENVAGGIAAALVAGAGLGLNPACVLNKIMSLRFAP